MLRDCPDKPPLVCDNCGEEGTFPASFVLGVIVNGMISRSHEKEL